MQTAVESTEACDEIFTDCNTLPLSLCLSIAYRFIKVIKPFKSVMELLHVRRQRVGTAKTYQVLSLIDEHLKYIRFKISSAHNTSVL